MRLPALDLDAGRAFVRLWGLWRAVRGPRTPEHAARASPAGGGAGRLQRARDDPFRLLPPRRREGMLLCIPLRMIVVPITHDLIHLAAVHTACLSLSLLDEVAEERGAWRKRRMVTLGPAWSTLSRTGSR